MIELVQFPPLQVLEGGLAQLKVVAAPRVAIVIPSYNEERFIGSVVIQALRYASEVVVVDDGSRDGTAFIAEQAGARVLRHVVNKGKSEACNTGLLWAREHNVD